MSPETDFDPAMLINTVLITSVRNRLLTLRQRDGGWGYRPGTASSVEPSALASLALLATSTHDAEAQAVARWIVARCRRLDGSTTVSARSEADTPGWTTPFALLLWNALGGFENERAGAVAWLMATKGKGYPLVPNGPMGHDTRLIGWPWVADTHSWVEPTSTALLALAPRVPADDPRVVEGVRVLLDRAIPTGGWNLGNPVVFGKPIRPLPGPTGLALLALARLAHDHAPRSIIDGALAYSQGVVRQTNAPVSLGWATLGLRAWDAGPDVEAADHLAAATDRTLGRDPSPVELAMLLLAIGERSLAVLGIEPDPLMESAR